jgi:hypothetical protein
MLIWINGAFGVGKTQTAHELQRKIPGSIVVDPELLGFGIQRMYPPRLREDFQTTKWWAPTVAEILVDITSRTEDTVIVPMTLADPERHGRIVGGLQRAGVDVKHLTLLASEATVRRRLSRRRERSKGWATEQFARVDGTLRQPEFATHLDTDGLSVPEVVQEIGLVVGLQLTYSRIETLALPARKVAVTLRHLR